MLANLNHKVPFVQKLTAAHKAQLQAQEAGVAAYRNSVPSGTSFFSRLAHAKTLGKDGQQQALTDLQIASQGGPFVFAGMQDLFDISVTILSSAKWHVQKWYQS